MLIFPRLKKNISHWLFMIVFSLKVNLLHFSFFSFNRKIIYVLCQENALINFQKNDVKLLIDNRHFIMSVGTIEILRISDNVSLLLHLFAILG